MHKRIVMANDHGALEVKQELAAHLKEKGFEVVNLGVDSSESVDYPDMTRLACEEFLKGGYDFGIVCCGTGIGVSIAANKVRGIRCALPQDIYAASMAKQHNDANFIAFGGRVAYHEPITAMLDAFIEAEHEGGRHGTRVKKIMDIEKSC